MSTRNGRVGKGSARGFKIFIAFVVVFFIVIFVILNKTDDSIYNQSWLEGAPDYIVHNDERLTGDICEELYDALKDIVISADTNGNFKDDLTEEEKSDGYDGIVQLVYVKDDGELSTVEYTLYTSVNAISVNDNGYFTYFIVSNPEAVREAYEVIN